MENIRIKTYIKRCIDAANTASFDILDFDKLSEDEQREVQLMISSLQNSLGVLEDLGFLKKYKLEWR